MSESMFVSLETEKRSIFVANQLIRLIERGELKVGDRLPPERQISKETGVSRPCVREALVALEILGILERKAGAGTFVVNTIQPNRKTDKILDFLSMVFRGEYMPMHMMQARRALELGALQVTIHDFDKDDVEQLERSLNEMHVAMNERDPEAFFESDMKFHKALMGSVSNPIIESIMNNLIDMIKSSVGWVKALQQHWQENPQAYIEGSYNIHEDIVNAVKSKSVDKLYLALERHYESSLWWRTVYDKLQDSNEPENGR